MNKKIILLVLVLMLSCDQEKGAHFTDDLIAVGVIGSDIQVYVGYLREGAEMPYNSPPYKPERAATVSIETNEENYILQYVDYHDETNYGAFRDQNSAVPIIPGNKYFLHIDVNGKELISEITLPQVPDIVNIMEGDTVDVVIEERSIPHPTTGQGLYDKGNLMMKTTTFLGEDVIHRFNFNYPFSYHLKPSYYSFRDSIVIDVYANESDTLLPITVYLSVIDSSIFGSYFIDFNNNDVSYLLLEGDVQQFIDESKAKTLLQRSNIIGGLGMFGAIKQSTKSFVARIIR